MLNQKAGKPFVGPSMIVCLDGPGGISSFFLNATGGELFFYYVY